MRVAAQNTVTLAGAWKRRLLFGAVVALFAASTLGLLHCEEHDAFDHGASCSACRVVASEGIAPATVSFPTAAACDERALATPHRDPRRVAYRSGIPARAPPSLRG